MLYLTAPELAELTGYSVNQYACMRRWLERHRWPFAQDRHGLPRVLRAYHDERMRGRAGAPGSAASAPGPAPSGPRFEALKGMQHHGRNPQTA
jgi:hypothetical protein